MARRLAYKYTGVAIFSDKCTRSTYTHLVNIISTKETILAERAYERVNKSYGMEKIEHYYADNLRSNDKEFQDNCNRTD